MYRHENWHTELFCVLAEPKLYMKVGDEVVLKPDDASVPGTIESILWKHGGNIAAELDDTGVELFRQFKGIQV